MAKYNLIFTVRDKYGKEKDLEGVEVDIDLASLKPADVDIITEKLDLESYATDKELAGAIKEIKEDIPTIIEENTEAHQVLTNVVEKHIDTLKYRSFDAPIDEEVLKNDK